MRIGSCTKFLVSLGYSDSMQSGGRRRDEMKTKVNDDHSHQLNCENINKPHFTSYQLVVLRIQGKTEYFNM